MQQNDIFFIKHSIRMLLEMKKHEGKNNYRKILEKSRLVKQPLKCRWSIKSHSFAKLYQMDS